MSIVGITSMKRDCAEWLEDRRGFVAGVFSMFTPTHPRKESSRGILALGRELPKSFFSKNRSFAQVDVLRQRFHFTPLEKCSAHYSLTMGLKCHVWM